MRRVASRKASLWLWPILFAAAMALSALIPPLQSPDEHSHLARAYLISKGEWLLSTPPGMSSGGFVDKGLLAFADAYSTIIADSSARLTVQRKAMIANLQWGGGELFFPVPGTGYYTPMVYAPHAAAMWLGRSLDLSIASTYHLVRGFCVLSCLAMLAMAARLLQPPALAIALLALPMTLFQFVAPTLDGVTTCLAVLTLSIFWRRLSGPDDLSAAHTWAFAACVALLASSRVQLLPLLAMPFYLAWARGYRRDALAGTAAGLLSAIWLAYALTHTVDQRVKRGQATSELLTQYAFDPGAYFSIVWQSVSDNNLSRFYAASFIGVLGWLDTWLPVWSYPVLWGSLAACTLASLLRVRWTEAPLARAALACAALACAGLVFFAMLITWTPHPALTIEGVQGRYFIVPAIILAYATGASEAPKGWRWPAWSAVLATAAVSLYALIPTLLARYH
jgi:uncharacterized membrane protein